LAKRRITSSAIASLAGVTGVWRRDPLIGAIDVLGRDLLIQALLAVTEVPETPVSA
jgi:hypothetical protein